MTRAARYAIIAPRETTTPPRDDPSLCQGWQGKGSVAELTTNVAWAGHWCCRQAVKSVHARHRLLLSGTPLQNNVLELWSLFDFLMPSFLGTERQFYATYGKSVQQGLAGKTSAKKDQEGTVALEALHKKVMPFLLRRTKDQVLKDLPPKIIQDIYCDLSPMQHWLYGNFERSQAATEVQSSIAGAESAAAGGAGDAPKHVFVALQYLRKLCSSPLLALEAAAQPKEAAKQVTQYRKATKLEGPDDPLEVSGGVY